MDFYFVICNKDEFYLSFYFALFQEKSGFFSAEGTLEKKKLNYHYLITNNLIQRNGEKLKSKIVENEFWKIECILCKFCHKYQENQNKMVLF